MASKKNFNPDKIRPPMEEAMTMVITLGKVGKATKELAEDIKILLSPYTYPKLKAHANNKLKDFIQNASDLHATMLMQIRSSLTTTTLSFCRFPHGPTLYFNIERFANIADVRKQVENFAVFNKTQLTIPFLILEGFSNSHEDQVMSAMFQGLFPALNVGTVNVSDLKRCVFISKDENGVIMIRHYKVQRRDLRVSDSIRQLVKKPLPDLSGFESFEDYILSTGIKEQSKPKTAIQLLEIGPRIDMTLNHIETAVFGGMKMTDSNDTKKPQNRLKSLPRDENIDDADDE